jgi:ribose 5-phosphate isomerase A
MLAGTVTTMNHDRDRLKRVAARRAVDEVEDSMVLGLGSGSTVGFVLEALAARVAKGLRISGIPTSGKTADLARQLGIPLTDFARHRHIDLAIDGADEVERSTLHLIKGGGGALLREKIVASASARMIIVVDESKLADRLGTHVPLPVEIVTFGWQTVFDRLTEDEMEPTLRKAGSEPFVTDGGNYIADCAVAGILDPPALEKSLAAMIGVVESGLFIGLASKIIVGGLGGVTVLEKGVHQIKPIDLKAGSS